ncbi:MAG: FHA domain-containing protein [Pseudomonadota bacterium]
MSEPDTCVLIQSDEKRQVAFTSGLTIGRHPSNGLVLQEPLVSARHACIEWSERGWTIQDLGSSNGTTRNRRRVQGRQRLGHGDILCFAGVQTWRVERLVAGPGAAAVPVETVRPGYVDASLRLDLSWDGPENGVVRVVREQGDGDHLLGEARASTPFALLARLAEAEGAWVDDRDLRSALWGAREARMARSNLHTQIGNTRRLLERLGALGMCIDKNPGQTRLALRARVAVGGDL